MQTFLPFSDFTKSASCLDNKRLGKQRVEVKQILNALKPEYTGGWRNHPAVRMWRGNAGALARYGVTVCREWIRRGFKDSLLGEFEAVADCSPGPSWLGSEDFHRSHRSNLLRKLPEHYSQFGWTEPDDLPYVWPVPKATGNCFEAAAKELLSLSKRGEARYRLVHGEIVGQGPIEGIRHSHAWVLDAETDTVIDTSNGRRVEAPRVIYEAIARLQNKLEYGYREACIRLVESGHYGPWELVTATGL